MQNWQFHEELKQLNKQSYGLHNKKTGEIVKGNKLNWKVEAIGYDPVTNFKAIAYSNGKNLVYSFVGTENSTKIERTKDWQTNIIQMGVKRENSQYEMADKWVNAINNHEKFKNKIKYSTGHSEGGTEATLIGKKYGIDTVTFNAYNAKYIVDKYPNIFTHNPKIVNYGMSQDLTFNIGQGQHIGETYVFPDKKTWWKPKNVAVSHPLNVFPPLNQAKLYNPQTQYVNKQNGKIENFSKNWQNYYNQPQNFKSLNIEKQLSLKNPVVEGISNGNALLDQSELIVHQSLPTITPNRLAWLGQLGNILSTVGRLASTVIGVAGGFGGSASGVPTGVGESIVPYIDPNMPTIMPASMRHTGGKITPQPITNTLKSSQSHDEVLAILRGGETVRTEAQEQELQGEKYKDLMNFIGPMLEDRDKKPKTIEEAYDPNNKVPCLLNKTTTDEEIIISIIGQAWKSNRLGFRNVLRYE